MKLCPHCGANLALVGATHRCIQRVANTMANASSVANDMANKVRPRAGVSTYRYRDADARRGYMRDYMRQYRRKIA
jgi:hypothetical protein